MLTNEEYEALPRLIISPKRIGAKTIFLPYTPDIETWVALLPQLIDRALNGVGVIEKAYTGSRQLSCYENYSDQEYEDLAYEHCLMADFVGTIRKVDFFLSIRLSRPASERVLLHARIFPTEGTPRLYPLHVRLDPEEAAAAISGRLFGRKSTAPPLRLRYTANAAAAH